MKTINSNVVVARVASGALHIAAAVALLAVSRTPLQAQWIEPAGQGWASFSILYQDTDDTFGQTGDLTKLSMDGTYQTTSSFLTVALGVAPGLEVRIQPSFHRLRLTGQGQTAPSTGLGDMRLYLRASPAALFGGDFPFAIRAGLKAPVGDRLIGIGLVPLGDHQRDWEVAAEARHSFHDRLYIAAWAGYRWREAVELNSSTGIWTEALHGGETLGVERFDFGNERFFNVSMGGGGDQIGFKAQLEGWFGAAPALGEMMLDKHERELIRFIPSVLVTAGPGQIEAGSRLPLSGKNVIAGPEFVLSYLTRFSL